MNLQLDQIKTTKRLQPRKETRYDYIAEYAEAMQRGDIFPPLEVVFDGETYWLWDGYHRYYAYKEVGASEATVNVTEGDLAEAEWLALSANKTSGKHRASEDKRKAVELAFEHPKTLAVIEKYKKPNFEKLSKHCGVSANLVSTMWYDLYPKVSINIENPLEVDFQESLKPLNGNGLVRESPTKAIDPALFNELARTDILEDRRETEQLAKLDPDIQAEIVKIIAAGEAKTVTHAKRELTHRAKLEAPPIEGKYRIFYADPPWKYNDTGLDDYGHAERHYPPMTITELCEMGEEIKVASEDDAVLFLWATSPFLEDSFKVIKAWGFEYKTSFVWDKVKHNYGHYNSVRHEFLLVCTRGSCTPDSTVLYDSVQSIERSHTHSEKPEFFRSLIDTLYTTGNRIELFARKPADNWKVWGNEYATA